MPMNRREAVQAMAAGAVMVPMVNGEERDDQALPIYHNVVPPVNGTYWVRGNGRLLPDYWVVRWFSNFGGGITIGPDASDWPPHTIVTPSELSELQPYTFAGPIRLPH